MEYLRVASILILLIYFFRLVKKWRSNPGMLPYPPGPKGLPIIGNLFDLPKEKPWLTVNDWFSEHGDMVYYEVFGQSYLALGSLTRAHDLLEKRSNIYSSRPPFTMLRDLCGWDFDIGLMPYGPWWRRHRRIVHEHFNLKIVPKYRRTQTRETRLFLQRILNEPDQLISHIRYSMAGIFMDATYGHKITGKDDPLIDTLEEGTVSFPLAAYPGKFLVDLFPLLLHIPSWFPGAKFKRQAKVWKAATRRMVDVPYEVAKIAMNNGVRRESMVSEVLQSLEDLEPDSRVGEEKIMRNSAAVTFVAGADTTHSSICTFFLAMALNPDIQRQAQAEIDLIVGSHRLPTFEDRDSLPYIDAIVKEVLRWQNVIPLGFAHMSTEDDVYDGYFIPKGTLVLGCAWSILHDPQTYPNPLEFQPSRFLKDGELSPDIPDPNLAAFGFGRRICPGRHFADETLFMAISSVLAVFDIAPSEELKRRPHCEMTDGVISFPKPFACEIKARSRTAEALIKAPIKR